MGKKIIIIASSIIVALLIAGGAYAYYLYNAVKDTANKIYEPVESDTDDLAKKDKPKTDQEGNAEPISILLMGVDERANDTGRSDTLIVMTLNPKKETMQMVSIPRDTRTTLIGKGDLANNQYAGTVDKINHSYAFGGTKMAKDTVENFVNLDIDHYIRMNMEGLSALINAVGGVTVQNDLDWHSNGYHYQKGKLQLSSGKKALGYVRMRHQDPAGDFGRNDRQRQVIEAIIDKAAHFSSVTRFDDILNAIGDNVKTDISFEQMKHIGKNYRSARHHVKTYEVKGQGKTIDDIYYLLVNDNERQKVHNMINQQL